MPKTIGDTFLFGVIPDYKKAVLNFITKAERVDTKSQAFDDIVFDVKRRRVSEGLTKILVSPNLVLGRTDLVMPKAFKAFVAKDPKSGNAAKVFIDVSEIIKLVNGKYDCSEINWLISYVVAGMTYYIYSMAPNKILMDTSIINDGGDCFKALFSYIIDRIYKITSVPAIKKKIDYVLVMYYMFNLLGKDQSLEASARAVRNTALKLTDIDDKDARTVDIALKDGDFDNLNTFLLMLGRVFNLKDITVNIVLSKWMEAFQPGTQFAMEFFPAFSMMLTHAYIGGFLNNQNLIEKITGKPMVAFCKSILRIGDSVV